MHDVLVPEQFSIEVEAEEVQTEEVVKLNATENDIAKLMENPGFKALIAEWEKDIADYRSLKVADLAGLSLEKIGEKFIIASTVADELENRLNKVRKLYELRTQSK